MSAATDRSMHLSHGRDLEHLNLRRLHSVQQSVARRREIDILLRSDGIAEPSATITDGTRLLCHDD
jgi:hypothetical protein